MVLSERVVSGRGAAHGVYSRRSMLRGSLATVSAALCPLAAGQPVLPAIPGKPGLKVLSERPINAETPAHLLDDPVTPAERMFVRNNGIPPDTRDIDPLNWTLELAGEACARPMQLTLGELKDRFEHVTLALQIECGGNGRSEFHPPARGNQWTTGAVACPRFTGVRLKDVLEYCGTTDAAVYVAYEAADTHLSGDPTKQPISRGVPMHKALEAETLIAWAMNGEPLPPLHGYPLRLVAGGWPGSVSGKWLKRILVRDRVHDGPKMGGQSYRVPCDPVAPGATVPDEAMCIIESMPVKSLITHPRSGSRQERAKPIAVRGHAWAGDLGVASVFTSIDFGATWQPADLNEPANRLAWQQWSTNIAIPTLGYYEIWARAVDENGRSQPLVLPGWNPRGYLNNACHRIALAVA
ncbi:MAG: sulfite oxidase [Gammaproteobacteria bacterium]|nr:sulfite oxidase [Gammaproteobacteria bacterium]